MGEDIGRYGGCYAVTKGLVDEFGEDRIRDTPLSESGYVGAGIGAAMAGMRPIVEIMTVNFSLLALDQIVNNAATIPHMSGGQFAMPLVIRIATGGGRRVAAQHSHSLEGWYAHIPGLRILAPATRRGRAVHADRGAEGPEPGAHFRARHAVQSRRRFERRRHRGRYRPREGQTARPRRHADHLWRRACSRRWKPPQLLEKEGVDAEVLELRVLRPLDTAAILESVRKTRKCVIVDEGWRSGSLSAEVGMRIAEEALFDLDAPLRRVCGREVPMPYAPHLEDACLPQAAGIAAAARELVKPT